MYEFNLRVLIPNSADLCAGESANIPLAADDPYFDADESNSQPMPADDKGGGGGDVDKNNEGCELQAPAEQAPVHTIKDPRLPSQKDIDEHYACGHAPFRDWCSICVKSRGVDPAHSPSKEKTSVPTYEIVFCFVPDWGNFVLYCSTL